MSKRKKILVTGVAGMLGSHLTDTLLEKGYMVVGVDDLSAGKINNIAHNLNNANFIFYKADILNYKKLEKIYPDIGLETIVHLAASKKISEDGDSLEVLVNNVKGTENTLKLAKKVKCKFILGSTSDVYGASLDIPFKEDGNLLLGSTVASRWSYAVSKIYAEQLTFAYYKKYKVPIVIIRYFGTFSPRSNFDWRGGHIPVFIDAILNDREVIIHGDGTQTRSMGYISDIINGTVLCLREKEAIGHIFNIGNDEEMSVIDSAYLIHKIANTGKKLKLRFMPYKRIFGEYKDLMRRVPDLKKSRRILGFKPKVKLIDALKETIKMRKKTYA